MMWQKKKKEEIQTPADPFRKETAPPAPAEISTKQPESKDYVLNMSLADVEQRILDLQRDDELNLYLKIVEGQRKMQELINLKEMIGKHE